MCVGGCVFSCVYVCKCIKHTEQIGPEAKQCSALIVCDSVGELKGILPLNHRDKSERDKNKG